MNGCVDTEQLGCRVFRKAHEVQQDRDITIRRLRLNNLRLPSTSRSEFLIFATLSKGHVITQGHGKRTVGMSRNQDSLAPVLYCHGPGGGDRLVKPIFQT